MTVTTIWKAQDQDGVQAELDHLPDKGHYQLSLENGPFSGHPVIDLTTEDLQRLHATLGAEEPNTTEMADDLATLAAVGRLYLDALDADPEHELLTLTEAYRVTAVREAVERAEARNTGDTP